MSTIRTIDLANNVIHEETTQENLAIDFTIQTLQENIARRNATISAKELEIQSLITKNELDQQRIDEGLAAGLI